MTVKEILAQRAAANSDAAPAPPDYIVPMPPPPPPPPPQPPAPAAGSRRPPVRRAAVVTGESGYQIEAATIERGPIVRPPNIVSLSEAGFLIPSSTVTPRITVCTTAGEKVGKTHWALTAPGPIAVISTDTGTREVVERFIRNTGKRILLLHLTAATALLEAKRGDQGEAEWQRAKDAIYSVVADPSIRTLVVDTATEVWELCRLAAFGKLAQVKPQHYAAPNGEFRTLLKYCYEVRGDLNSVWIHKHKKEYKGSGKDNESSNWTGKYERSGMSDVPFLVDVVAEQYKRVERDNDNLSHLFFGMRVLDSRLAPEYIVGSELESEAGIVGGIDDCSFATLAMTVWPETTADYWV